MLKGVEAEKRNDIWYDDEVHMDLSARQRLSARLELYLKLNNLLDQDETEVLGDPYGAGVTRWREREQYGRSGLLGLSYSF
jgi:outer membrane receptor protein involved in Fe transport